MSSSLCVCVCVCLWKSLVLSCNPMLAKTMLTKLKKNLERMLHRRCSVQGSVSVIALMIGIIAGVCVRVCAAPSGWPFEKATFVSFFSFFFFFKAPLNVHVHISSKTFTEGDETLEIPNGLLCFQKLSKHFKTAKEKDICSLSVKRCFKCTTKL